MENCSLLVKRLTVLIMQQKENETELMMSLDIILDSRNIKDFNSLLPRFIYYEICCYWHNKFNTFFECFIEFISTYCYNHAQNISTVDFHIISCFALIYEFRHLFGLNFSKSYRSTRTKYNLSWTSSFFVILIFLLSTYK